MSAEQNEAMINWEKLNADATAIGSVNAQRASKSVFLKVKQGTHTLRLLPAGNSLQKLPYVQLSQHAYGYMFNGKRTAEFLTCWTHIWNDFISQDEEGKKTKSILSWLFANQKINQNEFKKYQEFGCPFCAVARHLDTLGLDKDVKNQFWAKTTYLWNVIWRKTNFSGDDDCYVWSISKTQMTNVLSYIKLVKDGGKNALSLTDGYDLMLTATGEGFGGANGGRRYSVQFNPMPNALNVSGIVPHDLMQTGYDRFHSYQEACNMLKKMAGKLLADIGYAIPGDELFAAQAAASEPVIEPVVVEPPNFSGGNYVKDGYLYDASGKKLF